MNSICSVCTCSTRSMVASSSTCGRSFALLNVPRCSRVSFSDVSITLLISGIWLIGCQFTRMAFGMVGFSSSGHDGFGGGPGPPAGRLEVAAVGNDVDMCQRRDTRQIFVLHLVPGG